jgi:hypothetical protein
MLKGGALYYAILVSFLIALLSGFLMINVRLHHFHTLSLLQNQRLERNVNSALLLAKETPASLNFNQPVTIDLYNEETDEVTITKKLWGGYFLLKAEVAWHNIHYSAIEMCGSDIFQDEPVALYLADKERYLSVSGKTYLNGNCYLPKLGIRRAYIEGVSYIGDNLIHGKIEVSKSSLPEIEADFIAVNKIYLTGNNFPNDSLVSMAFLMRSDSIYNSFYQKTAIFYSDHWISLINKKISGNIKIVSSRGITLGKQSQVQDAILYAPKIEIEAGFSGSVQLFARDTLMVGEESRLLFPSLIIILEANSKSPLIKIGKKCKISGDILLKMQNGRTAEQAECYLEDESSMNGRIYCEGKLQLRGSIKGSVYCSGFILRTPASLYENHLLNATIDFHGLSRYYSAAGFFKVSDRYKAIKTLY